MLMEKDRTGRRHKEEDTRHKEEDIRKKTEKMLGAS